MHNSTLCYLENDRGEYLMLHRVKKKADINKGKWIGIGGKFEEGESPDECLRREVWEETGLTIEAPRLCGLKQFPEDDGTRYIVMLYKTDRFSGELRSSDEGKVFWIKRSELDQYRLPVNFDKMIRVFEDDGIGEQYVHFVGDEIVRELL